MLYYRSLAQQRSAVPEVCPWESAYLWSPSWNVKVSILHQCLHRYRDIRNFILLAFDLTRAHRREGRCEAVMCRNNDEAG